MALNFALRFGVKLAFPYISRMVNLGYSGAEIGRRVASFGWEVSPSWVGGQVRRFSQTQITGSRIAKYDSAKSLPGNAMNKTYLSRGRNYKMLVGIGDYDNESKTWSGGYRTFYSDDNLGVDGWLNQIDEDIQRKERYETMRDVGYSIINVTQHTSR